MGSQARADAAGRLTAGAVAVALTLLVGFGCDRTSNVGVPCQNCAANTVTDAGGCFAECQGRCAGADDGCGGTCGSTDCTGCCDDTHACVADGGQSDTVCGSGGSPCANCATAGKICHATYCRLPDPVEPDPPGWLANPQVQFKICAPSAEDQNLRLEGTFGFSVSYPAGSGSYRLYATTFSNRMKWNSAQDGLEDVLFTSICSPALSLAPSAWDPRCKIDSIGLFSKTLSSAPADNLWDAYPGSANVDTVPSPTGAPIWPRTDDYGVSNFAPLITRVEVNDAIPAPPPTGNEAVCHPYDTQTLATAASNPKPVQVYYGDGSNRWFMAFNENINAYSPSSGWTSDDNWRVLWAYSDDGFHWTIDTQILFRSASESRTDFCGAGLLLTDMLIDDAKFYVTFTEVGSDALYLARTQIDADSRSTPGYYPSPGWSVATYPIVGGELTWTPVALGTQLNLTALDAVSILPSRSWPLRYGVKQASIARVFEPGGGAWRYYAATSDFDSSGQSIVQLWSSSSLTRRFMFESTIIDSSNTSAISPAAFGWELGFTHYADNLPPTPRVLRSGLDFWVVQNLGAVFPAGATAVTRRTARLSPIISAPAWAQAGASGLTATVTPRAGSSYSWDLAGGTITAGQGTSTITFSVSAAAGTTLGITAQETTASSSCLQPPGTLTLTGTAKLQVDFADVPASNQFHDFIDVLARNGVTTGCGYGNYCPADSVSRDQMAVFLMRAKHGATYVPPAATGSVFADVPATAFAAAHVEQANREGIIAACNGNTFCPGQVVTREDMARFLLKAQRGSGYLPPSATGLFGDVPASRSGAPWIEQAFREGIASGCGGTDYCPDDPSTRGELAMFVARTFELQ